MTESIRVGATDYTADTIQQLISDLERLKTEGSPGVMHEVDRAFYRLVVKERDAAREQLAATEAERDKLSEALAEANTEIECYRKALRKIRTRADNSCHGNDKTSLGFAAIATGAEIALRVEVWDSSVPPGGYVCAVCRIPVESEPCAKHNPAAAEPSPQAVTQ